MDIDTPSTGGANYFFDRDRDLIRRSQAGDPRATECLILLYRPLIKKWAARFYGPLWKDRLSAGTEGFLLAVRDFDLRSNSGLACFAIHRIQQAIRALVRDYRRRGQSGATREDRWLFDNVSQEPAAADVVEAVGCTLRDAELAIERRHGYWHGHEKYDSTESGSDDADDAAALPVVQLCSPSNEVHASGPVVTHAEWEAIVLCITLFSLALCWTTFPTFEGPKLCAISFRQ